MFLRPSTVLLAMICGAALAQRDVDHDDDPDRLVFPEPVAWRTKKPSGYVRPNDDKPMTSVQFARILSSFTSEDDFLKFVMSHSKNDDTISLGSRLAETGQRSMAEKPRPAFCEPELQVVSLQPENEPSMVYYPTCTRVLRCGGCCNDSAMSCQPTANKTRFFEVQAVLVHFHPESHVEYKGNRIVAVEEHTQCECRCKKKAEECTKKQVFNENNCSCDCINQDERKKCNSEVQWWNHEQCTCSCIEEVDCSTGFYFDQSTCRCRQVPLSREWFPSTKGADYAFGQTQKPKVSPVIVPLDAADPRRKPKDDPVHK